MLKLIQKVRSILSLSSYVCYISDDLFGEFVEDSDDIDAGFRKERNNEDGPDSYEEDLEEDKHRFRYHKKNPYRG